MIKVFLYICSGRAVYYKLIQHLFRYTLMCMCWHIDIRTFEVLLRTFEVHEGKMDSCQGDEGLSVGSPPCKRRQRSSEGSIVQDSSSSPTIKARPCADARGHTGYLTFSRLKCLSWRNFTWQVRHPNVYSPCIWEARKVLKENFAHWHLVDNFYFPSDLKDRQRMP